MNESNFGIDIELELYKKYHLYFEDREDLYLYTTFQPNYEIPIHNWYKYTQAFSSCLIDHYIKIFDINTSDYVLDPFAGVGTTPLYCQQKNISSIGIEISPLASFIANSKLYTYYNYKKLKSYFNLLQNKEKRMKNQNLYAFNENDINLLKFIPGKSLSFIYEILNLLTDQDEDIKKFYLTALLSSFEDMSYIRKHGSHYRFMNKNNLGVQKKINFNEIIPSVIFNNKVLSMLDDVKNLKRYYKDLNNGVKNVVINDSIFNISNLNKGPFTHIITSPPYLNRNNYIAQQKAEMFIFKILSNFKEYRDLTKKTFRSHVEAVKQHNINYTNKWIQSILDLLNKQELSYPTIPEMISGYFEDLYATLKLIKNKSQNNCIYCFVVGNSRWSGIVIPVDTILLTIAEDLNFYPLKISVTRYKGNSPQQMSKYGKYPLRESIVLFKGDEK